MARALYGHIGSDPLLAIENARLRSKVAELEAELTRLRAQRDDELTRELSELAELTVTESALA